MARINDGFGVIKPSIYMRIRIGTRKSRLALTQANIIASQIKLLDKNITIEVIPIQSMGDKLSTSPLALIGGKGLFLKELEEQLLTGYIDIAVHSMKDVPILLPEGLAITSVLKRSDPRDVFISKHFSIEHLPAGATVGTSSSRRKVLLKRMRSDINAVDIRGNVDTRLKKLNDADVDSIILAAAGLNRLGLSPQYSTYLDCDAFIPAVAQGAIGVEYLEKRSNLAAILTALVDPISAICISTERAFLRAVGGDCSIPLGAYASIVDKTLTLRAFLASPVASTEIKLWIEKRSVHMERGELLGTQMGIAAQEFYNNITA